MIVINKKLTVFEHEQKSNGLGKFGKVNLISKKLVPLIGKEVNIKIEIDDRPSTPPIYSTEE